MANENQPKTVGSEVKKTLSAAALAIAALLSQSSGPVNTPVQGMIERAKQQTAASAPAQQEPTPAPLILQRPIGSNELLADHRSHSSHSSHTSHVSHRSHYSGFGAHGGSGSNQLA